MARTILSSTYFGPIQWYQKINRSEECVIDRHENFIKQSYRNRCVIATTNGLQNLTVPVTFSNDMPIKDVEISDHGNWRHLHWNALCSAYGESPFFEYYQDDIKPFFEKRWKWLFDFDMAITSKMIELLDIDLPKPLVMSEEYQKPLEGDKDFRIAIRPKKPLPDVEFQPKKYYQVYQEKYGFQPNLSILDLLFNEGNEAIFYL